jgi:hypothetical protein
MRTDKLFINIAALSLLYFFCDIAMAQGLDVVAKGRMETVQTVMSTIGAIAVTIALVYVGIKMVFQAAEWKDVAPVFWGGVLIGGASIIGGFLIKGS